MKLKNTLFVFIFSFNCTLALIGSEFYDGKALCLEDLKEHVSLRLESVPADAEFKYSQISPLVLKEMNPELNAAFEKLAQAITSERQ